MSEAPRSTPPPGAKPLWGSHTTAPTGGSRRTGAPTSLAGGPTGGGWDELEPLSQRLLQAAGILSVLLVLVIANSLLNQGAESPFNPNPVAAAAEQTQAAPGMRFTMEMEVSAEAGPLTEMSGTGSYNAGSNLAEVAYRVTGPKGQAMEFGGVLAEEAWYFHYPPAVARLPEGKQWAKVEGLPGQSEQSMGGESPVNALRMIAAAGSVKRTGHLRIRGTRTTHYEFVLTAAGVVEALRAQGKDELAAQFESIAADLVGPVRGEVFIDGQGMLRRVHTESTALLDGRPVTTNLRMDFFDFGITPAVQVPDDSLTFDMTPLLEGQMDGLAQAS